MKDHARYLNLFRVHTGRTTTSRCAPEPRINELCGFMPSYMRNTTTGRIPAPKCNAGLPDGIEQSVARFERRMRGD